MIVRIASNGRDRLYYSPERALEVLRSNARYIGDLQSDGSNLDNLEMASMLTAGLLADLQSIEICEHFCN